MATNSTWRTGPETPLSEVDRAQEHITRQIATGIFKPGDKLVEAQIARELNISRTPIREALARLHAEGIVESRHKAGVVVARLTRADLEDLYEIRTLLEGYAARLAAANITLDELGQAEALIAALDEAAHDDTGTEFEQAQHVRDLNGQLHFLIAQASRNHLLPSTMRSTLHSAAGLTLYSAYSRTENDHFNSEHRAIVQRLAERDGAGAEDLMRKHVRNGLNVLLRAIQGT